MDLFLHRPGVSKLFLQKARKYSRLCVTDGQMQQFKTAIAAWKQPQKTRNIYLFYFIYKNKHQAEWINPTGHSLSTPVLDQKP